MDTIDEVGRGGSTCTGEERAPASLLVGGGEAAGGQRPCKARVCRRVAACLLTRRKIHETDSRVTLIVQPDAGFNRHPCLADAAGAHDDLEPSTITPLVKRLEQAGHVVRRRNPSDERQVKVLLTD